MSQKIWGRLAKGVTVLMFIKQFNLRTGNPLSYAGRKNGFLLPGLQTHRPRNHKITLN